MNTLTKLMQSQPLAILYVQQFDDIINISIVFTNCDASTTCLRATNLAVACLYGRINWNLYILYLDSR